MWFSQATDSKNNPESQGRLTCALWKLKQGKPPGMNERGSMYP